MLDKRIEAAIPRNDVKESVWIAGRKASNVVSNVKVQSIWTNSRNLDILRTSSHTLHSRYQLKRKLVLCSTNEQLELEVVTNKETKGGRLHALEIDKDYVCTHLMSFSLSLSLLN